MMERNKKNDKMMKRISNRLKKMINKKYRKPIIEKYGNETAEKGIMPTRFKHLVKKMHKGFPEWERHNIHERFPQDVFKSLLDQELFVEMPSSWDPRTKKKTRYFILGAPALPLVAAWESNELSKRIERFTLVLVAVGVVTAFYALMQNILTLFG